jgi:hypothetical protein
MRWSRDIPCEIEVAPFREVTRARNQRLRALHGRVDIEADNMDEAKAAELERLEKKHAADQIREARERMRREGERGRWILRGQLCRHLPDFLRHKILAASLKPISKKLSGFRRSDGRPKAKTAPLPAISGIYPPLTQLLFRTSHAGR